MQSFIKLNLQVEKKPETENFPKPEGEEAKPLGTDKRLSRLANRAAHKAATVYGRGGAGIFSK